VVFAILQGYFLRILPFQQEATLQIPSHLQSVWPFVRLYVL